VERRSCAVRPARQDVLETHRPYGRAAISSTLSVQTVWLRYQAEGDPMARPGLEPGHHDFSGEVRQPACRAVQTIAKRLEFAGISCGLPRQPPATLPAEIPTDTHRFRGFGPTNPARQPKPQREPSGPVSAGLSRNAIYLRSEPASAPARKERPTTGRPELRSSSQTRAPSRADDVPAFGD
jgi:hypothetical protein